MYFIYHGLMSYVWKLEYLPWGITLPPLVLNELSEIMNHLGRKRGA